MTQISEIWDRVPSLRNRSCVYAPGLPPLFQIVESEASLSWRRVKPNRQSWIRYWAAKVAKCEGGMGKGKVGTRYRAQGHCEGRSESWNLSEPAGDKANRQAGSTRPTKNLSATGH